MAVSFLSGAHAPVTGTVTSAQVGGAMSPAVPKSGTDAGAKPLVAQVVQVQTLLTLEQAKSSLDEFQQAVQKAAPGLELSIDEELGVTVVKFRDTATNEVIKQFPSEEMLNIARSVTKMQGMLVSRLV